jgi:hypothetical protein
MITIIRIVRVDDGFYLSRMGQFDSQEKLEAAAAYYPAGQYLLIKRERERVWSCALHLEDIQEKEEEEAKN